MQSTSLRDDGAATAQHALEKVHHPHMVKCQCANCFYFIVIALSYCCCCTDQIYIYICKLFFRGTQKNLRGMADEKGHQFTIFFIFFIFCSSLSKSSATFLSPVVDLGSRAQLKVPVGQ